MRRICFLLLCAGFASMSHAQNQASQKEEPTEIRIRICPPTSETKKPLLFVNDFETDFESMILSPNNIKEINVRKDSAATALYGSKGANGVILIRTKAGTEFYKLADFVSTEKNINTSVKQIELNGKLLPDMTKLLIEKTALPSTTILSGMKVDEKNCEMVFNDTLVIKTQNPNDKQ